MSATKNYFCRYGDEMKFGVLEFEAICVVLLMAFDILLGTINHVFIRNDNVSSIAIKSIGRKSAIMLVVLFVVLFTHLDDKHIFQASVDSIIALYSVTAVPIIALVLYYELTSVLKHVQLMTGIDFTVVPGVKAEIDALLKKGRNGND